MITLLKNAQLYSPASLGRQHLLVSGNQIAAIEPNLTIQGDTVQHLDVSGCLLLPGLVDSLVHIIGGGGEGGFASRTPELDSRDAFAAGVTTLVGVLGTDSITRTLTNLLAKAHGLEAEGLSCYCYSGSYQVPVRTLFPTLSEDLLLIDKFIGVGEVAIADHRSSQPTVQEMARLASEARVGGMLAGKAGIVSIHTGPAAEGLQLLHQVAAHSDIPLAQFYPTHINRNQQLLAQGFAFIAAGGTIDLTTSTTAKELQQGEVRCADALLQAYQQGIDCNKITFSSDANASLPLFDETHNFLGLAVGRIASLLEELQASIRLGVPPSIAIAAVTANPARLLKLSHKGQLKVGNDADLLLLDQQSLQVKAVMAKGVWRYSDGSLPIQVVNSRLLA